MGFITGGSGAKAAKKAAEAQAAGIQKQIDFDERSLNTILGLQAPQQEVGFDALSQLASIVGINTPTYKPDFGAPISSSVAGSQENRGTLQEQIPLEERRATIQQQFEDSPIYQNVYQNAIGEGTKSLERLGAARKSLYSGSTIRGIEDYAGQLGANTWNQYQNTLSGLAGVGQTATGQAQGAIQNAASSIGQGYANQGNAQAQGIYNAAQSKQQGWNNIFKLAGSAPQALAGFA